MKQYFLIFGFLFQLCWVGAQPINCSIKPFNKTHKYWMFPVDYFKSLGKFQNTALYLSFPVHDSRNLRVQKYQSYHRVVKFNIPALEAQTDYLMPYFEKHRLSFEEAMRMKDKVYVFSSFQDASTKKHILYGQLLDPVTLKLDKAQCVAELDYSGYNRFKKCKFAFSVSPDSSKLMVFFSLVNKENEVIRTGLNVLDMDLNLIRKIDINDVPMKEGYMLFDLFKIDNNANVYIVGKYFESKAESEKTVNIENDGLFGGSIMSDKMLIYSYVLYIYPSDHRHASNCDVKIPNYFCQKLNLYIDPQGGIRIYGLFSTGASAHSSGFFTGTVNKTGKIIENVKTFLFKPEMLALDFENPDLRGFGQKMSEDADMIPFDYTLEDISFNTRGEPIFISDQYINRLVQVASGNRNMIYTLEPGKSYHHLFVCLLDSNWQFKHVVTINKPQSSKYDWYASDFHFMSGNKIYFLYNITISKKDYDAFISRVDENGALTTQKLNREGKSILDLPLFRYSIQVGENSVVYNTFATAFKMRFKQMGPIE